MVETKIKNNKSKIITQLYFNKVLTSNDLSNKVNKSLPYTIKLISELIDEELVMENGLAPSTGGRRAATYSLNPDQFYVVSVAMDQLYTQIVLMDIHNHFVTEPYQIDLILDQNELALPLLAKYIKDFLTNLPVEKYKITGVGIGMPGFIDLKQCINLSFLPLMDDKNIVEYLTQELDVPVFIDNDSSLIALAELRFGAAKNKKNVMVINIGYGVGLGMVMHGDLYRGETGFAGELSHIPLYTNNKLCSCGKNGCLETETSLIALMEKTKEILATGRQSNLKKFENSDPEEFYKTVIKFAQNGDTVALEALSKIAYQLGRGAAILIHLLNPELIVLSGKGSIAGKLWIASISQSINEYCIPRLSRCTDIILSTLGSKAELYGAAALVMENYNYMMIEADEIVEEPF